MATDVSTMPVNGNYAPHQGYGGLEPQQNNYAYTANTSASQPATTTQAPPSSTTPSSSTTGQQSDVPKDEVGWYFVEQYYTTLSRNPDKLYLFYHKRSQFVSGEETDKVQVCIGQKAINDRIKELDFQDCKVRVTNVDSQASDSNIVIQVIGQISNKSQPHRKFTQTFVLATQVNGYFVLNDIFRYLLDEEDEPETEGAVDEVQQAEPAAESEYQESVLTAVREVEPKTLTSSMDPLAVEHDAQQVDKGLEEKTAKEDAPTEDASPPATNGIASPQAEAEETKDLSSTGAEPAESVATDATARPVIPQPEMPKEPEPTPSASPPKEATPQPAPPPKPTAPKTWASLAASANRVATPVTPSTASSADTSQGQAQAQAQTRPTPPSGKSSTPAPSGPSAPAVQSAPAAQRDDTPADANQQDEWTAVGGSHNRQQSRQTHPQPPEPPQNRGYIKNVYESIDGGELKAQLEQYGEVVYFEINRQRNNALIEFKTAEGYNAAVAANPHTVGGERLYVEERRRSQFVPRGQFQGGRGGRGGVNQNGPRGNFQGRGGGGYAPRGGRGGAPTATRGRGGAQVA